MRKVGDLVYVDAEEMKEIDRRTVEDYGIDVLSLMENAGAAVALLTSQLLGGKVRGKRVACLAGKGNNGGDGLVASRRLWNWGADVTIVTPFGRGDLGTLSAKQLAPLVAERVPVEGQDAELEHYDLLIDSLLGYSSAGPPRDPIAGLIRRANDSGVPILAVDIPSGLDPSSGIPGEPCIAADSTLTLVLPKTGFLNPASRRFVGTLYLGDVSIPMPIYRDMKQEASPFINGQMVKIG